MTIQHTSSSKSYWTLRTNSHVKGCSIIFIGENPTGRGDPISKEHVGCPQTELLNWIESPEPPYLLPIFTTFFDGQIEISEIVLVPVLGLNIALGPLIFILPQPQNVAWPWNLMKKSWLFHLHFLFSLLFPISQWSFQ